MNNINSKSNLNQKTKRSANQPKYQPKSKLLFSKYNKTHLAEARWEKINMLYLVVFLTAIIIL